MTERSDFFEAARRTSPHDRKPNGAIDPIFKKARRSKRLTVNLLNPPYQRGRRRNDSGRCAFRGVVGVCEGRTDNPL